MKVAGNIFTLSEQTSRIVKCVDEFERTSNFLNAATRYHVSRFMIEVFN